MKVLGITGMPWSGKSEAVHIARSFNVNILRMGDYVWQEVQNRGLPLNDQNVGSIASDMRNRFGQDIWAQKTLEAIKKMNGKKLILIDGIRSIHEVQTFQRTLESDFVLIAIIASDAIRYARAQHRGRADDSVDLQILKRRDKREISWGIKDVIAAADITIHNESTKEDFADAVKQLFLSFLNNNLTQYNHFTLTDQ